VTAEFDLVCDNAWRQALLGSMYFVGVFIGVGAGGALSDRIGRRVRLCVCVFNKSP
jgi:MFS family permease